MGYYGVGCCHGEHECEDSFLTPLGHSDLLVDSDSRVLGNEDRVPTMYVFSSTTPEVIPDVLSSVL